MELKHTPTNSDQHGPTLLIVPYGIETRCSKRVGETSGTFNRTLWNWNSAFTMCDDAQSALLIVPYGIETNKACCYACKTAFF